MFFRTLSTGRPMYFCQISVWRVPVTARAFIIPRRSDNKNYAFLNYVFFFCFRRTWRKWWAITSRHPCTSSTSASQTSQSKSLYYFSPIKWCKLWNHKISNAAHTQKEAQLKIVSSLTPWIWSYKNKNYWTLFYYKRTVFNWSRLVW